jgi:drug/metabolite transporter (DMT)-like permease
MSKLHAKSTTLFVLDLPIKMKYIDFMNKQFYLLYLSYFPYIAGATMAIIFGFSYLFINEAIQVYTTFELLAYRFLLASIVMTGLVATKIITVNYKGKRLHLLLLLSFFQPICYFISETFAVKFASVSETGIFVAFIPIFATVLAYFILKEKPYGKQALFISVSVTGAVFIVAMSGTFEYRTGLLGIIFLCGIVLSAGGYNITTRKASKTFTAIEITFFSSWVGAVFFTCLHLFVLLFLNAESSFDMLFTINGAVPILYLGILSSILGFFLLNYVLSKLSVASASIFSQTASIVTILSGVLILGETFHWYQFVGGSLILTGVFGTNYYERKKTS